MRVAVVGATGLVGRLIVQLLAEREFPLDELSLFASRGGRSLAFGRGRLEVGSLEDADDLGDYDLVLSSTPDELARERIPDWLQGRARVVDESAAWRRAPEALLAAAGVNDHRIGPRTRLLASPNCTTTQIALALAPVHRAFGIEEVVVSTYQAASGAGSAGLAQLRGETTTGPFERDLRGDLLPRIGREVGGATSEEDKLAWELPRLLEADFPVHATCVRVPVEVGHAASVWVRTRHRPDTGASLFEGAHGVRRSDEAPGPRAVAGTDEVIVARVRPAGEHAISLWCLGDNLRVGAALNAVRLAELLVTRTSGRVTGDESGHGSVGGSGSGSGSATSVGDGVRGA